MQQMELQDRLISIAGSSPWFMQALKAVRNLNLERWCIGAGAIRNLVWDSLHGFHKPSALADVDVAFFDRSDISAERDQALHACLMAQLPEVPWEVTNQAGVHTWFQGHFGYAVEPLTSLEAAVASWPEYATCVGVTLDAQDQLQIIAPHGLDDLFDIVIRRNPARVTVETYQQRIASKRYESRWPQVRVVPAIIPPKPLY